LRNKSILTIQEIEALLAPQSTRPVNVDWFFAYRSLFLTILAFASGLALIIAPDSLAREFFSTPDVIQRYTEVFYFRGWMILCLASFCIYAYTRGKGDVLALIIIAAISVNNFLLDFFSFYQLKFRSPTPEFSLVFALRVIAESFVIINAVRCLRLPPVGQRWNFSAALKSEESRSDLR
jgi:hypothetical protein